MRKLLLVLSLTAALALVLALVMLQAAATPQVAQAQTEPTVEVPFLEEWQSSGHADATAEAFKHWNEESPAVVPTNCAKCHSTPGFQDFLGADGSPAGQVDKEVPVGTVITCVACHNQATRVLDSVTMPSGAVLADLGPEARCMQCHQGRASAVQVDESIEKVGLADQPDTVSPDLGFINIHYYAAAATKYGTLAKGGYEYPGKTYDGNFNHVAGYNTCVGCHNPHTLEVKLDECQACHTNVQALDDVKDIRMAGSQVDYDGDGNIEEGIYYEIQGLQEILYHAIQAYAKDVAGTPIVYDVQTHPYFFADTNGNGTPDTDEAVGDNAYKSWTPRLVKAAYNYQVSLKDPGQFAHGGKYIIELLSDSIADLNEGMPTPVEVGEARRIDHGHFAGSEEAFRHWDEEGVVPATCVKCHTAEGLPVFLRDGSNISLPPSNGLECSTCHSDLTNFTRYEVQQVKFPSGAVLGFVDSTDSNLCLQCHQGRESTVSVNRAIAGLDDDTVSDKLSFLNVHYFAAGATLFGGEAQGAYQYEGQEYKGQFAHVANFDTCVECHNAHQLRVNVEACGGCHQGVAGEEDLRTIRMSTTDFDGDGDAKEGLAGEIETMREVLYSAMQDYAQSVTGKGVVYSPASYPYFFIDTNGNGEAEPDEIKSDNSFKAWTPRLLRAAYNYQYTTKDPGVFAHNGQYILQVLYDTLQDIGAKTTVDTAKMVRPE